MLAVLFLLVSHILARIVEFDEGCTNDYPARCPRPDPYVYDAGNLANDAKLAGKCEKDYSSCKIAQLCYKSEMTYQCPDGMCANRFDNCPIKQLECKYKE